MSNGFGAGATIYRKFTTRAFSTGAPTTLAGTPSIRIYKDGSLTQSTTGVSLTVDFDGITGLNHVAIDTSADGTFYSNESHFDLMIQAGTVGGTSVVGEVVGEFDLHASLSVSAAGGVTLADGVAHGGTPGSSTATLAMKRVVFSGNNATPTFYVLNSDATGAGAVKFETTVDGPGLSCIGAATNTNQGYGVKVSGFNAGASFESSSNYGMHAIGMPAVFFESVDGLSSVNLAGQDGAALQLTSGNGSTSETVLIRSESAVALSIVSAADHAVTIEASGTGKHGITSTGGTDGDGFHGVGTGTGVGFRSTPDAVGFAGSGGLDAAGVRAAIGMASANLDTQLAAISGDVTTIETSTLDAAGIRAAIGMVSANLDGQITGLTAAINTRLPTSSYVAPLTAAGTRAALGLATANLDTQFADLPTAAENADKLLGRNLEGGSDSGRIVREALYFLRNKWAIVGGVLTVCNTSDTSSWTATVTAAASNPVTGVDP